MADHLLPGLHLEESRFRARSIEGVETSTSAFVGPTRRGPITGLPKQLTSPADFERIYGGLENLNFAGSSTLNHVAHATRAYFANGGRHLYVMRTVGSGARAASAVLRDGGGNAGGTVTLRARSPGEAGNGRVILRISERPVTSRQTLDLAAPDSLLLLRIKNAASRRYRKGRAGMWREVDGSELPASTFVGDGTLVTTDDGLQAAALLTLTLTAIDADGFTDFLGGYQPQVFPAELLLQRSQVRLDAPSGPIVDQREAIAIVDAAASRRAEHDSSALGIRLLLEVAGLDELAEGQAACHVSEAGEEKEEDAIEAQALDGGRRQDARVG